MSLYSEVISLVKKYKGTSLLLNDTYLNSEYINSNDSVWTYLKSKNIKFKKDEQICCLSFKNNKCKLNILNRTIKNLITNDTITNNSQTISFEEYDISIFAKGSISVADSIIGGIVFTRNIIFENAFKSNAKVGTVGSGQTILKILINNIEYGTITFNPNNPDGIIYFNKTLEVNDGDTLSLVTTNIFDTNAQDFMITLNGISNNINYG